MLLGSLQITAACLGMWRILLYNAELVEPSIAML